MKKLKLAACALLITGMLQVTPQAQAFSWSPLNLYSYVPQNRYSQALALATFAILGATWHYRAAIQQYFEDQAQQAAKEAEDKKSEAKKEILEQLEKDFANDSKLKVDGLKDALQKYQNLRTRDNLKLITRDYVELFEKAKSIKNYEDTFKSLDGALLNQVDDESMQNIKEALQELSKTEKWLNNIDWIKDKE